MVLELNGSRLFFFLAQRALKVINFSLGSKKCAEQGFIVDPSPSHDPHSILSRMGPGGVTVEALDEGLRGAKDTARIQVGLTLKGD